MAGQRAGRLPVRAASRCVRFRAAGSGAFALRSAVEVRQGSGAALCGQGDGVQSGADRAVDLSVPGYGADRGPAPGSEASVSPALHEGGHRSAGRGGRDPGRSVRRGHSAHDAAPVRGVRRCPVRASGGALEQPSVPASPVDSVPAPSPGGGQDAVDAGTNRGAPQASSRHRRMSKPPPSRASRHAFRATRPRLAVPALPLVPGADLRFASISSPETRSAALSRATPEGTPFRLIL